ncbi:glycosyltransferase family 2 protein [Pseudomonas gessardii]|uniref:Glycosyltransferase family 2 protein n=1 Tax=Pseudomonas gessardii TaxID=78544 RepID=A0A7Y1MWI2_9PSED|nr:glycosyltransferase family 2 protein [Pseudomonas gessardii]NNA99533.1 glycosyltransferase family 2 protein [Pseudomonas gessardii]
MKVSLVVPVFNEEDAIPIFYNTVRDCHALNDYEVEIIFVNDGSQDDSRKAVERLSILDPLVTLVSLSRNFGKEAALFAGLDYSSGDAVIPIDVDLQDPIFVIPLLIDKWKSGFDVVLAKRVDRQADSFMKRVSAEMFYRLHNRISNPKIEENVGDFRLMSRQVVDEIKMLPERHLFMKGLLSWVGFDTAIVEYTRANRVAGISKFNGWKLWNLALEGITSFSTIPLRMWTYLGMLVATASLFYALWMVTDKLIWGNTVPGYPSIMTAILFLGGVQLIGIGVLGEYVGRIYMESKRRPKYIIKNVVKGSGCNND